MSSLAGFAPESFSDILYHPVSFDVENMTIITANSRYKYKKLPKMFLVEERRIGEKYEIRLKIVQSLYYYNRWQDD
jgi:hypothetical protein